AGRSRRAMASGRFIRGDSSTPSRAPLRASAVRVRLHGAGSEKGTRMTRRLVFVLMGWTTAASAEGTIGYYRHPALHADTIAFSAEGDLWRVGRAGGLASRLTSHPAEEAHPALSPDGTLLAFSAAYEGPTEVYTMPLSGGLPRRLTYDGDSAQVVGF